MNCCRAKRSACGTGRTSLPSCPRNATSSNGTAIPSSTVSTAQLVAELVEVLLAQAPMVQLELVVDLEQAQLVLVVEVMPAQAPVAQLELLVELEQAQLLPEVLVVEVMSAQAPVA